MKSPALLAALRDGAMEGLRWMLLGGVYAYRWGLSPLKTFLLGSMARCRYTPSCSEYARVALLRHGAAAGTGLAVRRICRCHPWGGHGSDPVPEPTQPRTIAAVGS